MARLGRSRASAKYAMRASLAAPSTGGAATRTTSALPRVPVHSVFLARGMTRTSISTPATVSRISAGPLDRLRAGPSTGSGQGLSAARRVKLGVVEELLDGEPRPVQQDLVLALAHLLLADELERVPQRRDRRFDRRLGVSSLELEAVDLALDVFEARLRLLQQQIGSPFGLADDPPGFQLGVGLDLVRKLLRRRQCALQVLLVLAVLDHRRFQPHEVLSELVRFTQRLLVVVGHGGHERCDLDRVKTAEFPTKTLLSKVERADIHT